MNVVPQTPWLFPEEQPEVVARMLQFGLLKLDNARTLPLKSGGKTDVYINLRDARNSPEAIRFISDLFTYPIRKLGVDRFIEVPHAVSCFAGPISTMLGIPYLTVRERPKEGRATDAKVIGHSRFGESVCIVDDVVTDGASKVTSVQQSALLGLIPKALVVLVDRQQGWQENFARRGIDTPVWAGMTLHDVRRHLIQTFGVMQRCDLGVQEKNRIIVALDGKSWEEILPVIDPLRTAGCILKVNDLLFDEGIADLLPHLSVYGRVMADFKGHDISQTVENTCRRFRHCPPWAVTVHASGGPDMIKAAVAALEGTPTKVLAVTVLTSIDRKTCEEIYHERPLEEALQLAQIAKDAGAHGLVSSPKEVRRMRALFPGMTIVTPGIRSKGKDRHDQKRVATPQTAMKNGADYLVMGRQILRDSPDPVAEVHRVHKEELGIELV